MNKAANTYIYRFLKSFLIIFASFISARNAYCSNVVVEFDSYSWDFGVIHERDGVVTHTFVMTNTTSTDIRIASATPSCSCIYATFTRENIVSGAKGEVEVKFTPSGAVGKVYREVQVLDSENKLLATLEITADVIPSDRSISERYHYALSHSLYANRSNIPFGYVFHGKEKSQILYLANSSDKPMEIGIANTNHLLTLQYPNTLLAGEEAEVLITYRTPDDSSLSVFVEDTLSITVNGERCTKPIIATMIATSQPEEFINPPVLRTFPSAPVLRKKGRGYITEIEIANNGGEELAIRAIQTPDHVLCNMHNGHKLEAGAKQKLEIRSTKKTEFVIHLFSNDPQHPMKDVLIKYE